MYICLDKLVYLIDYFIQANIIFCVKNNKLFVFCCDRHQLDQTSTLGGRSLVEVWSKFGRSLVEVSTLKVSTFGRNVDQTSTLGGQSLVEISTKLRHPYRSKYIIFI